MLKFTDHLVNKVDTSLSQLSDHNLGQLVIDSINPDGRTVVTEGKKLVNFALNNGLGLETDPRVKEGIINSTKAFGSGFYVPRPFFPAPEYFELEGLLSEIFGSSPLLALSTTLAHLGALSVLIQTGDLVILDFFVHSSIRMAVGNISNKATITYAPHNNIDKLERIIQKAQKDPKINNIWYLADGIYSMQGTRCPMQDVLRLLNKYDNFYAYIDDAHGMSIMGEKGKGYALGSFDSQPEKLIVTVSLSKSFGMGCGGAVVFPNPEWKRKVKICGSTFVFTAPIPAAMYGAGIAAAKIHLSPEITQLQEQLQKLIHLFYQKCQEFKIPITNIKEECCHIFYINMPSIDSALRTCQELKKAGFFVGPCIYPAISEKSSGIRVVINRHHQESDIESLAKTLSLCLKNNIPL